MASKVNTKFVVTLGAALLLAFAAVAYIAVQSIRKSGEDYIKMGDKAMAEAKYPEAVGFYARAVYKDQRNKAWIQKWIDAMEHEVPQGRAVYQEKYLQQYVPALKAVTEADRRDYATHRRWLEEQWKWTQATGSGRGAVAAMEGFARLVEDTVKGFQGDPAEAKKLWRYRGMALMNLALLNPDLKDEEIAKAAKDLEGAVEADPKDETSVLALATLDQVRAQRAEKLDDRVESGRMIESARKRVDDFVKAHPPAAAARMTRLRLDLAAAQRANPGVSVMEFYLDRRAELDEIVQAAMASGPELDAGTARSAAEMARAAIGGAKGKETARGVMDHLASVKAGDAAAQLSAAKFDLDNEEYESAITRAQAVVDMPDRPMSLDGLLLQLQRSEALKQQAAAALALWEQEKDPAKKPQIAARVKKYRDDLAARLGETSTEMLPIDARLAIVNGDPKAAVTMLTRYSQEAPEGGEAWLTSVKLLGDLMMRQGNLGAARISYERALAKMPEGMLRYNTLRLLAQIAAATQDWKESLRYTREALRYTPDDPALKEQVQSLSQFASGKVDDPVLKVLQEVQPMVSGLEQDLGKAEQTVRARMAENNGRLAADARMHRLLIQVLAQKNDLDGVRAALDAAIARFGDKPEGAAFKAQRDQIATGDPVAAAMAQIDKTPNATEAQKNGARYRLLMSANRPEEARRALAEAVKQAPDDPAVFDLAFDDAILRSDSAELERLADRAEQKNLDQNGGQLYRARMLFMKQTPQAYNDALPLLTAVVQKDKLNQIAWRLLGMVQEKRGESEAAVRAYSEAVSIKPQDVASINGLLRGLKATNRLAEMLDLAHRSEKFAAGDQEFTDQLVFAEGNAPGGDPAKALELRRRVAKARPDNRDNRFKLAELQIAQNQWDEARATIDALKADESAADAATYLEAVWHASQKHFEEAQAVIDRAIERTPKDKLDERWYLAAGSVLSEAGRPDLAVAFMKKGRGAQKKETMEVDRAIGDVCFQAWDVPGAVEAYKRVLEAGSPDEKDAVAKRLMECYIRQGEFGRFDEMAAGLGQRGEKDPMVLVLRAEAAVAQKDEARAAQFYDRAVAADPNNPVVFLRRGDFSRNDPKKQRDAEADYRRAIELAPGLFEPWVHMAQLYAMTGRQSEAVEALDKALTLDPGNDAMRMELVKQHLAQQRIDKAVDLIDQAVKLKPDEIGWLLDGGSVLADPRIGRVERGVAYLSRAWEKEKSLRVAVPYVSALLRSSPPDTARARAVVDDPALAKAGTDETTLNVLKAMVAMKAKQPDKADEFVAAARGKLDEKDGVRVDLFVAGFDTVYETIPAQLAALDRLEAKKPFTGWLALQATARRLTDPARSAKAAAELERLSDATDDKQQKIAGYRALATVAMQAGRWEEAAKFYRKSAEQSDSDAEGLNNAAYILAEKLNRPSEALPLATRAAEMAPANPTVLDTLGTVQLGLKECDKAERTLAGALEKAKADNERTAVMIHLAGALRCTGKKEEAQRVRGEVEKLLGSKPELRKQYDEDLKRLSQELDGQ